MRMPCAYAVLCLVALHVACAAGCCERKGYILRGDIALELNRVNHLIGRYDDYEVCPGDCDCPVCRGEELWGNGDSRSQGGPEPRLHPVPTRPVFAPPGTEPVPLAPLQMQPAEQSSQPETAPTSRARPSRRTASVQQGPRLTRADEHVRLLPAPNDRQPHRPVRNAPARSTAYRQPRSPTASARR